MIDDIHFGNYHCSCVQPTCFTKKTPVQVQMFVYTETTSLSFHTADWKTCSRLASFIKIKLVWRGAGNNLSYSKMRNLGMKADRKRKPQTRSFKKNINNSYKLSFSLKEVFVNLWHDQVCSHHRVSDTWQHTYSILILLLFVITVYLR